MMPHVDTLLRVQTVLGFLCIASMVWFVLYLADLAHLVAMSGSRDRIEL